MSTWWKRFVLVGVLAGAALVPGCERNRAAGTEGRRGEDIPAEPRGTGGSGAPTGEGVVDDRDDEGSFSGRGLSPESDPGSGLHSAEPEEGPPSDGAMLPEDRAAGGAGSEEGTFSGRGRTESGETGSGFHSAPPESALPTANGTEGLDTSRRESGSGSRTPPAERHADPERNGEER